MKAVKRIVCAMLAVLMLASVTLAFADGSVKDYSKQYKFYMSIGDSVASGYTVDWNSYHRHGYENYVPQAYPNLVRNALHIPELYQGAIHGVRTTDVRVLLEDDYEGDDYTRYFLPGWGPWTVEQLKSMRTEYRETIKKADIITLNAVNNDMLGNMTYELSKLSTRRGNGTDSDSLFIRAIAKLSEAKVFDDVIDFIFDTAGFKGDDNERNATILEAALKAVDTFKENWDIICDEIYELNPDVDIVAVCMYTPPATERDYGKSSALPISMINNYILKTAKYADKYICADVSGISAVNTTDYDTYGGGDLAHPDVFGHQQMADVIVNAVNEYNEELPFTDVLKISRHFDSIRYAFHENYMTGITDKLFMPAALLTRAQAADILYRLAGRPDVSGMREIFIDVNSKDDARDAIVWAYNTGLIKSFTLTAFAPDLFVTKAQFANMMYKLDSGIAVGSKSQGAFYDYGLFNSNFSDSVKWAVDKCVISGYADGILSNTGITRAATADAIAACYYGK